MSTQSYNHEILSTPGAHVIAHNRITALHSGILLATRLAITYVESDESPTRDSGLQLPNIFETYLINGSRLDDRPGIGTLVRTVDCLDLQAFIKSGREEWATMASAGRIMVQFAERESSDDEFAGYVAQPHEIKAIEEIALANAAAPAQSNDTTPLTGLYL